MPDPYTFDDERPHPLGLIDNPEWAVTRFERERMYLQARAERRRAETPARPSAVTAVLAAVTVGVALVSYLIGALTGVSW